MTTDKRHHFLCVSECGCAAVAYERGRQAGRDEQRETDAQIVEALDQPADKFVHRQLQAKQQVRAAAAIRGQG